jgi:hypothetical protein
MAKKAGKSKSTSSEPVDPEMQRLTKRIENLNKIVDRGFAVREMVQSSNPKDKVLETRSVRAEQKMEQLLRQRWNLRNAPRSESAGARATLEGLMKGNIRGGGLRTGGK